MALVSGKPISFISELYAPRYIQRALAELPEEAAMRPELHEGAIAGYNAQGVTVTGEAEHLRPVDSGERSAIFGLARKTPPPPAAAPPPMAQMMKVQSSSIVEGATGIELAELFEYRIAQPVTIKKNESAMLPFLQDKVKARKVDLYSDMSLPHPLNAAELVNSTGKTLDGGPITVFDAGSYAGEALVETVKSSDKRLISYGVDLGMRITNKLDSEEREEREIHANRGVLSVRVAFVRKTTYSINNVDGKAKTLIIEHPLLNGYRVLNQKPMETTSSANRFEIKLAGASTEAFPVVEERVVDETNVISSITPGVLVQFLSNKHLSDVGRRQLEQIVDLKRQIESGRTEMDNTKNKIDATERDETRVRSNLMSLNSVSGQQDLVQKYAGELEALERQITQLRDQHDELIKKNAELQAALDDRIEKMTF
jgi:chaperonin cofactor prefoldin